MKPTGVPVAVKILRFLGRWWLALVVALTVAVTLVAAYVQLAGKSGTVPVPQQAGGTPEPAEALGRTESAEPLEKGIFWTVDERGQQAIDALELNYGWTRQQRSTEAKLVFSLNNRGTRRVGDIEFICSFYTKGLDLLGTRRGLIMDTVDPGESKRLPPISAGFFGKRASRVSCQVIGLSVL